MPVTSQKNAPLTGLAADMGFGGAQLADQLKDETEEERKKRLAQQSMIARANPLLSPSTLSMFQAMGGYGR
jgi:hypothetical protein